MSNFTLGQLSECGLCIGAVEQQGVRRSMRETGHYHQPSICNRDGGSGLDRRRAHTASLLAALEVEPSALCHQGGLPSAEGRARSISAQALCIRSIHCPVTSRGRVLWDLENRYGGSSPPRGSGPAGAASRCGSYDNYYCHDINNNGK